ncbi:hypothetical protein C7212DRAFT_234061 [Tuber magnatum]|uniref:Uncharacterized protein n=1 Tax=Tuber magnatum TaxID=42249 RepID=A0A317SEK6_9PEZI|nr:hypothetical protein C7212DRAFT_234061 [Tuber magnatum]
MGPEIIRYYTTNHPLLVIVSIMTCLLCIARHPGLCHNQITRVYLVFFKRVRVPGDMCEAKAMEIGIVDIPRQEMGTVDILREAIGRERNCVSERPGKGIWNVKGSEKEGQGRRN